jgi:CRISPR/Cas system-associated endonuclease/helicase Cas3
LQRFGRCNRYGKQAVPADVSVFLKFPEDSARRWYYPYGEAHLKQTEDALQDFIKEHPSATLEEAMITPLLDRSYPRDLQARLQSVITDKTKKLKESFIEPFMPFGTADSSLT